MVGGARATDRRCTAFFGMVRHFLDLAHGLICGPLAVRFPDFGSSVTSSNYSVIDRLASFIQ